MSDKGPREDARKALREYDNPKWGKNPNYQSREYLTALLSQYNMTEVELRKYVDEKRQRRFYK